MAQDILDVLATEHLEVKDGLNRVLESGSPMQGGAINSELVLVERMTVKHLYGEEEVFYPRIRSDMPDLVNASLHEHQEIRTHMRQAMANLSDQQMAMRHLQDLKQAILHHVGEEQDKIFPRVREAFTSQQLEDMAVDFEDAKQRAPSIGAAIPGRAEASR